MRARLAIKAAPLVLLCLLAAVPAWAGDVVGVVPEGALGFGVVNHLAATDAKITNLAAQLVPQIPPPNILGTFIARSGITKGLDEAGSLILVVMPPKDDEGFFEPVKLVYLPTKDYQGLIEQLKPGETKDGITEVEFHGDDSVVGKKDGYAVFAEADARDTLAKALKAPSPKELKGLEEWVDGTDGAMVITRAGLELLCDKVIEGIAEFKDAMAQSGEADNPALAAFVVYEKMFKVAKKEVRTFGLGGKLDKQGNIFITSRTRVLPNGELAGLMAGIKPPGKDLLRGLPNGPFVLAGGGATPAKLGKELAAFSAQMMKAMPQIYGIQGKDAEKLADMTAKAMEGVRGMAMSVGVGKPGDAVLSNTTAVMWVDDAQKYLAESEKLMKAMAEMAAGSKGSLFKGMSVEKVDLEGIEAFKVTFQFPTEMPGMENMPQMQGLIDLIYGPGGKMTTYMTAADKHTIVSSYGSEATLKQAIKAAKKPSTDLSTREEVAKTAAMLPAGSQWVGYLSPKGLVDMINRLAPALMFEPTKKNVLPDFPATPAVGFSAKAVEGELQTTCIVPAEVIKGISNYIIAVQNMGEINPAIP